MEPNAPQISPPSIGVDCQSNEYTLRTTAAALASLLAARVLGLPETVWAVITTVIIMQGSFGAAWEVSWQRILGTLLGGVTGALLLTFFAPGLLPFTAGMLAMGLLCALLRLRKSAYRFAGITLAVVMLPAQTIPIWIVALHRFLEVAIGIVVGMAAMALWPGRAKPAAPAPVHPA
jgi:uncharacterized membrane protein YccC